LVNKFSHMRFEPMGHTTNPDIRIAKSVVDYIFRWMGITFLPGFKEANSGQLSAKSEVPSEDDTLSQRATASMKDGGQMPQGVVAKPDAPARAHQPDAQARAYQPDAQARDAGGTKSPQSIPNGATPGNGAAKRFDLDSLERAGVNLKVDGNGGPAHNIRSEQFAKFQLDAPSCDNCGSITVRNGNCYLCHNCGNSMGCS
jgi:ribonucleoside-diphosphate reductase alpha chain